MLEQEIQLARRQLKRSILDQKLDPKVDEALFERFNRCFPELFRHLFTVYGERPDFYHHLHQLVEHLITGHQQRPQALRQRDTERNTTTPWYQSHKALGMACYVDRFAEDLPGLVDKIPYLKSLGVTYLHLMPLYKRPAGENDGGYAVSDYREVDPPLGDMDDLKAAAEALREAGISLVLDFVFNHTADDHPWALAAKRGDNRYQNYYYLFDDRTEPDDYDANLREIFPQVRRGSFSFEPTLQKWVWTTFNDYQWDLNYQNPEVFNAITDEMLFLANIGCDVLRLDALAFIWKEKGTTCENQPKAHELIRAFKACLNIVAPSVVFKSEAIVHPDEVVKYIAPGECQLSYNPLLMALIWNSLATRKTRLLTQSTQKSFTIPSDCSWVNYLRGHDDIGWTFDDQMAWQLGINPSDHRQFLNQFYAGNFEGSFAKGVPFAQNPETGDCRVCGSLASLAGLEKALQDDDDQAIQLSIKRILMLHSIILSIGGIPLLYAGDELALLNHYQYQTDPHLAGDARWVNRPLHTREDIQQARKTHSPQHQVNDGLLNLIALRQTLPVLGQGETRILEPDNQHVFAYKRLHQDAGVMLILVNFSEHSQRLDSRLLMHCGANAKDQVTGQRYSPDKELILAPYQFVWLSSTD